MVLKNKGRKSKNEEVRNKCRKKARQGCGGGQDQVDYKESLSGRRGILIFSEMMKELKTRFLKKDRIFTSPFNLYLYINLTL